MIALPSWPCNFTSEKDRHAASVLEQGKNNYQGIRYDLRLGEICQEAIHFYNFSRENTGDFRGFDATYNIGTPYEGSHFLTLPWG